MIEASDGKACIFEKKKLFWPDSHSRFEKFGLDRPGAATPETLLDVYEMVEDANSIQMFDSLSSDRDKLVMSQNQIIIFCQKHTNWLRKEGFGTFFLIKKDEKGPATNDNLFVVRVDTYPDGLIARVDHFGSVHVFQAGYRCRLVVPHVSFVL